MPLHIQYTCKANSKQLLNSIFTLLSLQSFQLLWYSVHSEPLDLILMSSFMCWPNITKVTSEQPFEPKTKYCCCLGFSFFMTDWLFPWNTLTPQTYFCYSQLSQFNWINYVISVESEIITESFLATLPVKSCSKTTLYCRRYEFSSTHNAFICLGFPKRNKKLF